MGEVKWDQTRWPCCLLSFYSHLSYGKLSLRNRGETFYAIFTLFKITNENEGKMNLEGTNVTLWQSSNCVSELSDTSVIIVRCFPCYMLAIFHYIIKIIKNKNNNWQE